MNLFDPKRMAEQAAQEAKEERLREEQNRMWRSFREKAMEGNGLFAVALGLKEVAHSIWELGENLPSNSYEVERAGAEIASSLSGLKEVAEATQNIAAMIDLHGGK